MNSNYCKYATDGFDAVADALFALKSQAADDKTLYLLLSSIERKANELLDEFGSLMDEYREE